MIHDDNKEILNGQPNKKIFLETNGCEEGQTSTSILRGYFMSLKYELTNEIEKANIIIFFACGLTEESENKSLEILDSLYKKKDKNSELIVWGCLPKINLNSLSKYGITKVLGPKDIEYFDKYSDNDKKISDYCENILDVVPRTGIEKINKNKKTYYIRILRGCKNYCTYCSDRLVHGYVQSMPVDHILKEFNHGIKEGYYTFFLVGSDLGSYGLDINSSLKELLNKLLKENLNKDYAIDLSNMCPENIINHYEEYDTIFSSNKISHLSCPVQSGSNKILKAMGRRYRIEEWLNLINYIHKNFPKIRLTSHMMVGFPGESNEDFKSTLDLLKKIRLDGIIIFKYSDRPNIPSENINPKVPEAEKQKRYDILYRQSRYHMYMTKVIRFLHI